MADYRILSLDGGGIRGLLTVRLLQRIVGHKGLERAFDTVDLIAGNSSGGLIALALSRARAGNVPMEVALDKISEVFENGADVFGPKIPYLAGGFWLFSRYFTRSRRRRLQESLENTKLRDLGTHVLITTFDLDNGGVNEEAGISTRRWKPKLFHNFRRADRQEPRGGGMTDREQLARDVALYTTAAPLYFPTVDGYIDGGAYANNPSMCALAQVLDSRYEPTPKPTLDKILLLSVGAGRNATYIKGENHEYGFLRWGLSHRNNYVNLTMDATIGVADYQCRQMLGEEHYRRLDVDFPNGVAIPLDAADCKNEMVALADEQKLDEHIEWLKRYWLPKQPMVAVPADATSKHILGTSELICVMPIRSGFVDVFETHTYATRIRIVLRALHLLRLASREQSAVRVFPDIVDLVGSIHSFQLSIVGSRQLLLAVTFDRPWEPYLRLIWRELGALLDLILLNCEGYEAHTSDKGFEPFAAWVREHQVDADLFYTSSQHTVDDADYLAQLERLVREADPRLQLSAAKLRVTSPSQRANAATKSHPDEVIDQGLRVLATFYKLRDLYRDDTPDAAFLRAAAGATLKTFHPEDLELSDAKRAEYRRELEWFDQTRLSERSAKEVREPAFDQIQRGVTRNYRDVTHGCLLLIRIEDPARARVFLGNIVDSERISRHIDEPLNGVYTNVAFTYQGLKRLGLPAGDLAAFPKEFREGMEARAGLLGDVRTNHPEKWTLPEWNWDREERFSGAPNPSVDGVRLSTVDIVVQLRDAAVSDDVKHAWAPDHPLYGPAHDLVGDPAATGIRVMSVQPMVHHREDRRGKRVVVEHFGFLDGISQPVFPPVEHRKVWSDGVNLGELVLGYENDRGDPAFVDKDDTRVLPLRERQGLLDNGTFLVVRKLEQNVAALYAVADKGAKRTGLHREEVLGKLMGRDLHGTPLTDPRSPVAYGRRAAGNDFTYTEDDGSGCPLHAHIRKANPRLDKQARIVRRGMAYGPRYDEFRPDQAERGMIFLAFNASIAEQFEVIQRWMTGGNSSGGFSGCTDAFLRVPQEGRTDVVSIPLDRDVVQLDLGDEPFVSLKWGVYLFVPSIAAIARLAREPRRDEQLARERLSLGEQLILARPTDEEWSALLEDSTAISSGRTAAVCAALRELHGGVYRTPGGGMVLVASHELAMNVLREDDCFSVSEYRTRMQHSIGEIYLGMDSGDDYRRLSALPNQAIGEVSQEVAFDAAREITEQLLWTATAAANGQPVRLGLDSVVDKALAGLSAHWFGVPDGYFIEPGGRPADGNTDRSVHCPFHFLAPSRFIFSSPRPRDVVTGAGAAHGRALQTRMEKLARDKTESGAWPDQLPAISRAAWNGSLDSSGQVDVNLFARMLVGILEGFLPTVYGNFLKTMHLWLSSEALWRVQQDLLLSPLSIPYRRAHEALLPTLKRALQMRPVPDMVYRTAKQRTRLGHVTVEQGDRVVVLIASVTEELAARGDVQDVYPVFGGDRTQPDHPTHACPGYEMALGVLLGIVSAVLESGTLKPTPTPLVVLFGTDMQERQGRARLTAT